MLKSYLAIIDSSGLESIHEEQEGTTAFLIRRLNSATAAPRMLVWAVVSDDVLLLLLRHLRHGNRQGTWRFLQSHAHQIGSVATTSQPLLRA